MDQKPIKVAYVLTSDCQDQYADLNLISLWSLRQTNPTVKVILVCDSQTLEAITITEHQIGKEVDEIVSISVPVKTPSFRNRYIKTNLRNYLDGAFLYLDADTIIRGDLSPIFATKSSLTAVPNYSGTGSPLEIPLSELKIYQELNWSLPSQYYANGGVLFFADHSKTYEFCNLWHQKWLESSSKIGKAIDQPSLNSAIDQSKVNFTWLDHRFNVQIHARPDLAWDAIVWHIYFSQSRASSKTILGLALEQMKQNCITSSKDLTAIYSRQHPWLINNYLDWIAVYTIKRNRFLRKIYKNILNRK